METKVLPIFSLAFGPVTMYTMVAASICTLIMFWFLLGLFGINIDNELILPTGILGLLASLFWFVTVPIAVLIGL